MASTVIQVNVFYYLVVLVSIVNTIMVFRYLIAPVDATFSTLIPELLLALLVDAISSTLAPGFVLPCLLIPSCRVYIQSGFVAGRLHRNNIPIHDNSQPLAT